MKAKITLNSRLSEKDKKTVERFIIEQAGLSVKSRLERGMKIATQNALIQLIYALHTQFGFGAGRIARLMEVMEEQKRELDGLSDENILIESLLTRLDSDGIFLRPMMLDAADNEETCYFNQTEKERAIRCKHETGLLSPEQKQKLEKEAAVMSGLKRLVSENGRN
ncbi:MAG: hypothetical protein ACI4FZ_02615 [Lachnospiraceae bacterium]